MKLSFLLIYFKLKWFTFNSMQHFQHRLRVVLKFGWKRDCGIEWLKKIEKNQLRYLWSRYDVIIVTALVARQQPWLFNPTTHKAPRPSAEEEQSLCLHPEVLVLAARYTRRRIKELQSVIFSHQVRASVTLMKMFHCGHSGTHTDISSTGTQS